jgi:signal transduction histidine kinase
MILLLVARERILALGLSSLHGPGIDQAKPGTTMTRVAFFDGNRQRHERVAGDPSPAERAAHVAQKLAALGEMTGGIAHDFRNILAVVESGLRLAERRMDEPERLRAGIAAAREGVDRGARLISQLLAFASQQELGVQTTDANELLKSLHRFLNYGAGPGNRVVFKLASDIPECVVDRAQFGSALLNLVINARDAMPRGGEIEISTERWPMDGAASDASGRGVYVRVRVKDNGQGMSAEVMQQVFDPFFTTKGEKGTGLGLPQVHAFMQRIGGHIEIRSGRGVGTAVDLLFPTAPAGGGYGPAEA